MANVEINYLKIEEAKRTLNSDNMNVFVSNRVKEYELILKKNIGATSDEISKVLENIEEINTDVQNLFEAINTMLSAVIILYKKHDEAVAKELEKE